MDNLSSLFAAVFGDDFDWVGESRQSRDLAPFWVAAARAKRAGEFYFRHEYQHASGYRHRDDEGRIVVLPRGAPRHLRYDLNPLTICTGDTLLIPFAIGDDISHHRFRRDSRFPKYLDGPFETALQQDAVEGAPEEPVRYLGRRMHYSVHRTPERASMSFHAYFEATRPGRCNLRIDAGLPEQDPVMLSIAVARPDDPVTALLATASTHSYDTLSAVSTGWAGFPTSIRNLRPGDRFSVTYGWMTAANNQQTRTHAERLKPRISTLPYAIGGSAPCDAWLVAAAAPH